MHFLFNPIKSGIYFSSNLKWVKYTPFYNIKSIPFLYIYIIYKKNIFKHKINNPLHLTKTISHSFNPDKLIFIMDQGTWYKILTLSYSKHTCKLLVFNPLGELHMIKYVMKYLLPIHNDP